MTAPLRPDWTESNRAFLVGEFARLRALLTTSAAPIAPRRRKRARIDPLAEPSIDRLAALFHLTPFERDLLLLCAGIEMDAALAAACAAADPAGRPVVSFGLALARLPAPHWSAITPARPLRRWRLIEIVDGAASAGAALRIDERMLHFIAGVEYLDPRVRSLLRLHPLPTLIADTHAAAAQELADALAVREGALLAVALEGDDTIAQADVAAAVAHRLGLALHVLSEDDLPADPSAFDAFSALWQREAALLPSALLIACERGTVAPAVIANRVRRLSGIVFVAARDALLPAEWALRIGIDKPDSGDQRRLWSQVLGPVVPQVESALDDVCSHFRLSASAIGAIGETLRASLAASAQPATMLREACRRNARRRLDDLAQRVEPVAHWEDLVLPESQLASLRQIAAQVRQRSKVYGAWGFAASGSRGLGITALFAGESGTGKTMAAEVLANELHLDLYRIDLAATVSKYIGETEKNLRRLFDAAEDSGAILLFDEADALFGKRSEVKDSHDRYANIEVSYLLQRMELYRGLAILTTNLRAALDVAFQRRLRFIVQFPFPDATLREHIWRRIVPAATPVAALDYGKLARLAVAGGSIRNIALGAAFLAADQDEPLSMAHVREAAHADAAKRERPLADLETRGWA